MHMLLIVNILLIKVIDMHLLRVMCGAKLGHEGAHEVLREVVDHFVGVLTDKHHLTQVGFGGRVAFEAVFVAALLFAGLAVPAQALEAFGFELVGDVFCGADFGAGHGGWWDSEEKEEESRVLSRYWRSLASVVGFCVS